MATTNTGYQGWKVLEEIYLDDNSLTGFILPNIAMISPSSRVANTSAITYNYPNDVTPAGGADGDIIYNSGSDTLYKKISGTWTLLTDRVTNDAYVAPVYNITACPIS